MKKTLFLIVLTAMLLCFGCALCEERVFYVSENGDDENTGAEETPLRSIGEAFDRIAQGDSADVTIWLREGVYTIGEEIVVKSRNINSLSILAHADEKPIVTGAALLVGWESEWRNGQLVWKAPYAAPALRALYDETGALPNARYPKEGELRVMAQSVAGSSLFSKQQSFFADPSRLPASLRGASVRMPHYWRDEFSGVKQYEGKTGKITMNRKSSLNIFKDDPFWLVNVLDSPFQHGEWGYDAQAQMVYYLPLPGQTINGAKLYAGGAQRLFSFDGISNLRVEGVTFSKTGYEIPRGDQRSDFPQAAYDVDPAITISNGQNILFAGCNFENIGGGCLRFGENTQDVTVRDCVFSQIGAQAIDIRGKNSRTSATQRLTIENNLVSGYGKNFLNAPAVLLIHARDALIRNNTIHDGTYTAISVGWVWGTGFNVTDYVRIQNNLLYDIGHGALDDMGAVYTLGVQKNTVISGNIIYNVQARNYGGWGIYLDEGASGILVENNIAYLCSSQGFHQHNGVRNTVQNNVFAMNLAGQVGASDKSAAGTFLLWRNLLIGDEPYFYRKYGVERIKEQDNAFLPAIAPENLPEAIVDCMQSPQAKEIGFIPFEAHAGQGAP